MIPKIQDIQALDNFILWVKFDDGKQVHYDLKEDIATIPAFRGLIDEYGLYRNFYVDTSRTCVTWNEEIDLPSDCIYEYGKVK
ncbi:MAG: DUF2442 domain-containing protein [Paludibacteraceae bacterium]|nr:DUF2442 domain-containing protein [Paludibacteraceae bacterium]